MEVDFGIEEFVGERSIKIPCILKELYSDFIVQEILQNEEVLRIASEEEIFSQCKEEENKEPDQSVPLPSCISQEQLDEISLLGTEGNKKFSISTEGLSKDERKSIHEFIRLRFHGKLQSETKDNDIVILFSNENNRKRKRWHADTPDYCHFTLAKENKDTSYALGVLGQFLNVKPGIFRTHGIKDRRAVTTQRVSCNRIEKERIFALNKRLRGFRVYDFEYKDTEVKMGGHWGNRFSIILRNIDSENKDVLETRLNEISKNGFINYYGTQRFGSCDTNTAKIGLSILQRNWEEAVRQILDAANLPSYMGSVGYALRAFKKTNDAREAFKCLRGGQAYATVEAGILRCLSKGGTWQQCITDAIPVNMRSLYVHAYQSLLWNRVASRRIREGRHEVQKDDIGENGKFLDPSSSSIFNVYIPLPGVNESYESNYVSEWYKEMLDNDKLTFNSFTSLEDRFALGEFNRSLLIQPKDMSWSFINYTDPRSYLQPGIDTKAIPVEQQEGPLLALQVKFSLTQGVYATVCLREITGIDMGKKNMKELSGVSNVSSKCEEEQENNVEEQIETQLEA